MFFRHLLGLCPNANEYFVDVFNALFDTHLTLADVTITDANLDATFYTKLRNGVAKVVNGKLALLLERQSAINKNMQLRFLRHIAATYAKILNAKDKYRERLVKIPTPVFIVFYNGADDYSTESMQKLSDAFIDTGKTLELTVKIVNIGLDSGVAILQKSQVLRGYFTLFDYIADFKKGGYVDYVQCGINKAIEKGVLLDHLTDNMQEVINNIF